MKYLSVAEARNLPGVRLVLTAHMPGPWGEAAKAVLGARNVAYIPVEQLAMEPNEDLYQWTGMRNAPIAVLDDEPPPRSGTTTHCNACEGRGPRVPPSQPPMRSRWSDPAYRNMVS